MTNFRPVKPEEKQQIVKAFKEGMTLDEIRRSFKRASNTVKKVLSDNGLELPKPSYEGLMATRVMFRKLGISNNSFARVVKALDIKPTAENNFGGRFYTESDLREIRKSDAYKAVLDSRNHKKRAPARRSRVVKFPYNPDDLSRCVLCENLCSGRKCGERGITISRLSVRTAFYTCKYYQRKGIKQE